MVEGVTLPILLHWSSVREMRGDTTTIALPPATDLPDILYSKQTEESGSIRTPPGRCDDSHTKTSHRSIFIQNKRKSLVAYGLHPVGATIATRKHPIVQSQVAVLAQFKSALPLEDIG